jgi:MFS family permease
MAGILFSLLLMTSMILFRNIVTVTPADINRDWLETNANTASLALGLVPFAGIAFLWFTGVIRDRLGDREDRFFATVFLGSGIILVVMLFIWAAAFGAIFGSYAVAADRLVDEDIFVFGVTFMNEIMGNYPCV